MARYIGRKLSFYLVTFVVAVTVDGAIPRFMPGDPIQGLLSRMQAQPGSQEALTGYYTEAFGLDVPLWKQYLNFWAGLFSGDLGTSVWQYPRPVTSLIMHAVPYTLALLIPAIVLAFIARNIYDYIYRLPILDNQTTVNYERFSDPDAWSLTKQLDQTPATDVEAMKAVLSQLQSRFLDDMPVIPLWYNGLWAQWNTAHWTNWPSDQGNQVLPAMWRNYLQMTGIDMLTHLQAVR